MVGTPLLLAWMMFGADDCVGVLAPPILAFALIRSAAGHPMNTHLEKPHRQLQYAVVYYHMLLEVLGALTPPYSSYGGLGGLPLPLH